VDFAIAHFFSRQMTDFPPIHSGKEASLWSTGSLESHSVGLAVGAAAPTIVPSLSPAEASVHRSLSSRQAKILRMRIGDQLRIDDLRLEEERPMEIELCAPGRLYADPFTLR
jgi:hypothetical protein